jgi:hypothetical protein
LGKSKNQSLMAGFTFTERTLPKTFSPPALYVYNTPVHLELQSKKGWIVFECIGPKETVCARICVNIKSKAVSPVRAPFGSCEIYDKVSSVVLGRFLSFVEEALRKKKVKHVVIKSWPVLYQETEATKLYAVLVNKLKFTATQEVSSIIRVNKNTLLSQMKVSERQKAVKAAKLFSFNACAPQQYKRVYDFIHSCRKARDQTLSLSWDKLRQTVKAMPERFLFFSLTSETDLAAAAIVIRVSDTNWYTFYYAHAAIYNKVSPVVYLLSCIYEYAAKEKVKLIDLGTSMLDDRVNEPLLHFKQSVGAVTTSKFTFSKKYS